MRVLLREARRWSHVGSDNHTLEMGSRVKFSCSRPKASYIWGMDGPFRSASLHDLLVEVTCYNMSRWSPDDDRLGKTHTTQHTPNYVLGHAVAPPFLLTPWSMQLAAIPPVPLPLLTSPASLALFPLAAVGSSSLPDSTSSIAWEKLIPIE